MKSKNINYIPGLDHIRAYAIILVISFHCIGHFSGWNQQSKNPLKTLFIEGHTGVALFILSSGFIFYLITYNKKINYINFMKNRILRIYPLFVFKIFIGFSVFYIDFNFLSFIQLIAGFANLHLNHNIQDFAGAIWSIPVEFIFYLLFPLLLILVTDRKNYLRIIAMFIIFRTFGFLLSGRIFFTTYFTFVGRIDQFLIGMLTADFYIKFKNKKINPILLPLSILIILYTLLIFNKLNGFYAEKWFIIFWPDIEASFWAFFIFLYLKFCNKENFILDKIGEYSYSLYLMHSLVTGVIIKMKPIFWISDPVYNSLLIALVIVFPITFIISYFTYNLIEKPFLNMRVKYLKSKES